MILLGHQIIIYTDHKNLIHNDLKSERVLRWRLLMEEYNPDIRYIKGKDNIVADTLSRLPTTNDPEKPYTMPSRKELAESFAQDIEHLKTDLSHYALFLYDYAHNCTELYLIIYSLNLCHTIYLLLGAHSTTNLRNTF
jgi:hypothetical protein